MDLPKGSKYLKLKKNTRYSICSCGASRSLPFCDGKHRDLNVKEGCNYKSIKIIPSEDITVNIHSANWIEK